MLAATIPFQNPIFCTATITSEPLVLHHGFSQFNISPEYPTLQVPRMNLGFMLSPAHADFNSYFQRDPAPGALPGLSMDTGSHPSPPPWVQDGIQDVPPIRRCGCAEWDCWEQALTSQLHPGQRGIISFYSIQFWNNSGLLSWTKNPFTTMRCAPEMHFRFSSIRKKWSFCVSEHSLQAKEQQVGKKRRIASKEGQKYQPQLQLSSL